ncbi:protein kinase, putative [Phytophthora infestans T30-4]|uniref:Protein kinase, putative n=1 Tax=Phytophthora infestans (strain T30-4) TaxID=403677 RepID=D0MSM4_PHYIT|nr:protein kinase, putative [Phytophthora infestans T30-4]EEY57458.1 protein kinase, putative [Phytophthora infestans T30-4]|eukprot:XP_002908644.1 protein kinase, putative [Phytophthora infestans T30-4]
MGNYTMADLAVPKADVSYVDCTYLNCSQPNGVTAHYAQYCTGWQMLNVSRWDPTMTPSIRLRDHKWEQDIPEFGGLITFHVYVVHTVPHDLDPAWNECPLDEGYASLTVPCHRRIEFTDDYMAANTTVPAGSAFVTTWLKQEFAQEDSPSQLLIPVILGVAIAVAGMALGWLSCRRKLEASMKQKSGIEHERRSQRSSGSSQERRAISISSPQQRRDSAIQSLYCERAGSNKTLLDSEHLEGKRIPFDSIVFERVISKGASGEVWVCEFNRQKAAVKRLLQRKKQKAESVQKFALEIELTASLIHPNIVQFIGVAWNSLDNLVMVLEYLSTGSLKEFLEEPREFMSSNVLLTDSIEPKIIDFGVSRGLVDLSMTAGVGTPFWTAPEILEGNHYTEKADMYSFGVVLSELDTGQVPYHDAVTEDGTKLKPVQILKEVMSGTMRPSFSDECPPRIRRIGTACLSLDPSSRPTAHELVRQLEGRDSEEEEEGARTL